MSFLKQRKGQPPPKKPPNVVRDALSDVLPRLGFKKKGRRIWMAENDDVIWFVELRACWYGSGDRFVILGVILKKLDVPSYLGESGALVGFRLERVVSAGNERDRFKRNELNLNSLILTYDQKKASIIHWLEDVALPRLFRCHSFEAAKLEFESGDSFTVPYPVRRVLWPEKVEPPLYPENGEQR